MSGKTFTGFEVLDVFFDEAPDVRARAIEPLGRSAVDRYYGAMLRALRAQRGVGSVRKIALRKKAALTAKEGEGLSNWDPLFGALWSLRAAFRAIGATPPKRLILRSPKDGMAFLVHVKTSRFAEKVIDRPTHVSNEFERSVIIDGEPYRSVSIMDVEVCWPAPGGDVFVFTAKEGEG